MQNLTKGITREFVSTALLSMSILGSAVMASKLSEDTGIRLIINMVATVFMIFYLISVNSRHFDIDFNPAVTL
ncbi:MAG: antitoxin, partial [Actinobacteria bacterium]|nr:antitoxin [Actinomycetota bacterium]